MVVMVFLFFYEKQITIRHANLVSIGRSDTVWIVVELTFTQENVF